MFSDILFALNFFFVLALLLFFFSRDQLTITYTKPPSGRVCVYNVNYKTSKFNIIWAYSRPKAASLSSFLALLIPQQKAGPGLEKETYWRIS